MIPLLLALSTPLPCSEAIRLDTIVGKIEDAGGAMLNLVDIPGANVDQVLVIVVEGAVGFIPFKDGCEVGPPLKYDEARKTTPA